MMSVPYDLEGFVRAGSAGKEARQDYLQKQGLLGAIMASRKMGITYPLQIALVILISATVSLLVFSEKLSSVAGWALVFCGVAFITKG